MKILNLKGKNTGLKITSLFTTALIAITMSGCKINRELPSGSEIETYISLNKDIFNDKSLIDQEYFNGDNLPFISTDNLALDKDLLAKYNEIFKYYNYVAKMDLPSFKAEPVEIVNKDGKYFYGNIEVNAVNLSTVVNEMISAQFKQPLLPLEVIMFMESIEFSKLVNNSLLIYTNTIKEADGPAQTDNVASLNRLRSEDIGNDYFKRLLEVYKLTPALLNQVLEKDLRNIIKNSLIKDNCLPNTIIMFCTYICNINNLEIDSMSLIEQAMKDYKETCTSKENIEKADRELENYKDYIKGNNDYVNEIKYSLNIDSSLKTTLIETIKLSKNYFISANDSTIYNERIRDLKVIISETEDTHYDLSSNTMIINKSDQDIDSLLEMVKTMFMVTIDDQDNKNVQMLIKYFTEKGKTNEELIKTLSNALNYFDKINMYNILYKEGFGSLLNSIKNDDIKDILSLLEAGEIRIEEGIEMLNRLQKKAKEPPLLPPVTGATNPSSDINSGPSSVPSSVPSSSSSSSSTPSSSSSSSSTPSSSSSSSSTPSSSSSSSSSSTPSSSSSSSSVTEDNSGNINEGGQLDGDGGFASFDGNQTSSSSLGKVYVKE